MLYRLTLPRPHDAAGQDALSRRQHRSTRGECAEPPPTLPTRRPQAGPCETSYCVLSWARTITACLYRRSSQRAIGRHEGREVRWLPHRRAPSGSCSNTTEPPGNGLPSSVTFP